MKTASRKDFQVNTGCGLTSERIQWLILPALKEGSTNANEKESQDEMQFHPDSAWKRSSRNCMTPVPNVQ
jgi:hypothetical protein